MPAQAPVGCGHRVSRETLRNDDKARTRRIFLAGARPCIQMQNRMHEMMHCMQHHRLVRAGKRERSRISFGAFLPGRQPPPERGYLCARSSPRRLTDGAGQQAGG